MYPGTAPDPKSKVLHPAPWPYANGEPHRSRRALPSAAEHDPTFPATTGFDASLLVAALEDVRRRDVVLEWLLEEGLLGLSLAG